MKKLKKIISVLKRIVIQKTMYFNTDFYMVLYLKYLKNIGVNFNGKPNFISNDVYFDGKDYSKITIGENVTISREVMFLTHDYSMHTVYKDLALRNNSLLELKDKNDNLLILGEISIGNNSFIGARSSLLPGTIIGENVLVGACSVVKGNIPDDSIVVGNPARVIGKTSEWLDKKMDIELEIAARQ